MQIVIELTDEQWKCVQDGTWCGTKEILNGIPLPKGHGRLIDADAKDLRSELWTFVRYTGIDEAPYDDACMALDKAPTVIEGDGGNAE